MIPPLLSEYWLEALLTGGFVLLLALPFVWLYGKIKIEGDNYQGLKANIDLHRIWINEISCDYRDLKSRLDALDKPSNTAALSDIATILNKKAQHNKGGKSFSRSKTAISKAKKLANGGRQHAR